LNFDLEEDFWGWDGLLEWGIMLGLLLSFFWFIFWFWFWLIFEFPLKLSNKLLIN
jgi:hypothetical protein